VLYAHPVVLVRLLFPRSVKPLLVLAHLCLRFLFLHLSYLQLFHLVALEGQHQIDRGHHRAMDRRVLVY
jgi:hypothetical protein